MFSMCSELTPRARIPDTNLPQFMQPCRTERVNCFCAKNVSRGHKSLLHTCHIYRGTHVMKLLILSGKFLDYPEIFHTVRKFSRLSGNFPHCLETFHTGENFPDCRETFQTVWYIFKLILSYVDVCSGFI